MNDVNIYITGKISKDTEEAAGTLTLHAVGWSLLIHNCEF